MCVCKEYTPPVVFSYLKVIKTYLDVTADTDRKPVIIDVWEVDRESEVGQTTACQLERAAPISVFCTSGLGVPVGSHHTADAFGALEPSRSLSF